MRILWLAHRDPKNPRSGGAERTIYEVCTRLLKKGYRITLITGGWKGCKRKEELNGIEIYRFGKNIGPHFALPIFLLKNHFDLIVNDLGHAIPWSFSVLLNKHNVAFFRHLHARSLTGQVGQILARTIAAIERCYFIFYHYTIFVTESTTSMQDLIHLGINYGKIVMIPPGVDRNVFHPSEKSKYPSIVYFGGMRKYKRPSEVLYLLNTLIEIVDNVRLFVIGTGPEESGLKKLANELNIQKYVEFKGRLSIEELSAIVAASWLNIHTSVTEGWGYTILEASAAGTPTVAYNVPGIKDAVQDDFNGLKVEDGNREALAEATLKILKEPERWWSSSIEVAKKYSWETTADSWDNLIKRLVTISK